MYVFHRDLCECYFVWNESIGQLWKNQMASSISSMSPIYFFISSSSPTPFPSSSSSSSFMFFVRVHYFLIFFSFVYSIFDGSCKLDFQMLSKICTLDHLKIGLFEETTTYNLNRSLFTGIIWMMKTKNYENKRFSIQRLESDV